MSKNSHKRRFQSKWMNFIWTCTLTLIYWSSLDWNISNGYFHFPNCSSLISLIGTSATAMTGSTLFVLPMVRESMCWRKRSRRCFRAILFVASIAARVIRVGSVLTKDTPNILIMIPKNTVRAIDMLSVKKGTVLIMVVVDTLQLVDIDWEPCWENRT